MAKGKCWRLHWGSAVVAMILLYSASTAPAANRLPAAVLIHIGKGNTPEVVLIHQPPEPDMLNQPGLLVWSERGRERWQVLPFSKEKTASPEALAMGSRFDSASRADSGGVAMATLQLAQLRGLPRLRGGFFLTPAPQASMLDPKITIRRRALPGKTPYPATELQLVKRRDILVRVPLAEGQSKVAWADIPNRPKSLENGLPPGRYTLRTKDNTEEVGFSVADAATRQRILKRPNRLAELLGTKEDPLYLLVAVEHLLGQADEDGNSPPYMADVLDLLETASPALLTPYLKQSRDDIVAHLSGKSLQMTGETLDAATGIKPIDEARVLITEGKWAAAQKIIDSMQANDSPRAQGLAVLYRAVIHSESGQTTEEQVAALFAEAIRSLRNGRPDDLFRVHNNYANYLMGRTQDRLHNHAFQIASGVQNPLIYALVSWHEACVQYGKALALAEKLDRQQKAAVEVNMARLYGLLADVIHTLDVPVEGNRKFAAGQQAATVHARKLAEAAIKTSGTTDMLTSAIGHEFLAHLAFRGEDDKGLRDSARQATQQFLQAGSLPGLEGVNRLLGLWYMQQGASADARKEALRRLEISQLLAELLRERIPTDQIGLGRAGFFARRAYVNERIIGLLLADGKTAEALQYAELAKARALQDVMAAGSSKVAAQAGEPTELSRVLFDWPKEVAAVEYFLGSERAWVFLIDTSGHVSASPLLGKNALPTASRNLVARIRRFLSQQFPGPPYTHAKKMAIQWKSGKGVDHSWQDELHAFYNELLPEPVMKELRKAKTVLIVPHHILHYFPFVALVTQPGRKQRAITEMVEPTFLLDESFNVCYAPSLTAWSLVRRKDSRPITEVNGLGIVDFGPHNQLPGVEKDMANLKAVFGNRLRRLVPGDEATETVAKELFGRPGFLFVGTHGANIADHPLSSFLVLRPDAANDGSLSAEELYATKVVADMVVMSACYSGLADRSPLPGDDLFGLQRALLHSQARTIVSGLWDVYDGTAPELMRGFFQQLTAGQSAPAALAESQREFLKAERNAENVKFWLHPYFWAVYTVAGDDRTRFDAGKP